ncbi:metal-binding protein [Streptacidiphilus pinicola]|uniref:Metal-binding protein n=1 Tax=Streptacidiphilus pinicola TaxID=2219663 RepID=A0A2X0JZC8_9ACTN|nr:CYTH and CHAD domain-containing protein [Streptacidiphilus pinicola]RAG80569.1 metal-binding protein [Streptacidiphilus pinicola]
MITDAHTEREITFDGALSQELTAVRPPGVARTETCETEILDALYFDTADHGLLRRGATLRRRTGGHDPGWHLKLPDGHGGRREFRRPLDESGPEDEVPPALQQLACACARGQRLRPTAHLLTHRRRAVWTDGEERELAELAADHVAAHVFAATGPPGSDAGKPGPAVELSTWDELEVELTGGTEDLLALAAQELNAQGLQRAEEGIKLARALRAAGVEVEPRQRADIDGAGSTAAAVVSALRQHADHLASLEPSVRLDEPDAVHQMRVTTRRLRSVLRGCEGLFDSGRVAALATDLRWLGHRLGEYREPEALRERLTSQARSLPADCAPQQAERKLRRTLDRRCRLAHRSLLDALSSPRYFTLLDRLEDLVADPPLRDGKHPGARRAERILRHETRRTRRRMRKAILLPAGDQQDEALHRARKAAKRTRYMAGALRPVLGSDAKRQERRHKEIHKRLGRHQDARTAEQALAELAQREGTHPAQAFAFGFLRSHQRDDSPADIAAARDAAGL